MELKKEKNSSGLPKKADVQAYLPEVQEAAKSDKAPSLQVKLVTFKQGGKKRKNPKLAKRKNTPTRDHVRLVHSKEFSSRRD